MNPSGGSPLRAPGWAVPLALALYSGFALRDFLGEGLPIFFDAHSHLARSWFTARAFAAGHYPDWSYEWYGGYRLLQFYSPGYYALSAALGLLIGNVIAATKVFLWAAQILAVLAFYGFLRRLDLRPLLAGFGALLLLESAGRKMVFEVIGNYPTVLIFALTPALLFSVASCSSRRWQPLRLFAAQALLLGAMLLGHLTNTLATLPGVLAFEAVWLWQAQRQRGARMRALAAVAGSFAAAAALTAFATVPMATHLELVSLSLNAPALAPSPALEPLGVVAGLAPPSAHHDFLRSHGTLWFALGLGAGLLSLRRGHARWRPAFAGLCASLAAIAVLGDRAALGVGFFLFPLCAAALDVVSERLATWGLPAARSLVPLLGIGMVFFVPGEVTPALRYRPDDAFEVYAHLPDEPAGRTFDVTQTSISLDGFYGESSVSPYWSARALPFGAYPQGAPLGSQVSLALAGKLAQELGAPAPFLSDDGADILYLLHVRFLVDRGEPPVFDALQIHRSVGASVRPGVLELHHASPALFAPQLARLPAELRRASGTGARPALLAWLEAQWTGDPLEDPRPDPSLNPLFRTGEKNDWTLPLALVRAMEIDRERDRAARLFAEAPLPQPAQASDAAAFEVLSHREDLDSVEIVARASAPGFVRLSYAFDPGLGVSLDGQVAGVVPDALGGAIVLAFPAGTHTISLRPPGAGPRTALLGASAVLSVGLAGLLVAAGRRRAGGGLDPA